MDIFHWWQIKVVALQVFCLLGTAWGFRYIGQPRPALAKLQPRIGWRR